MPKTTEFKTIFKGQEITCSIDVSEISLNDLNLIEDPDEKALYQEAFERYYHPEQYQKR